MKAKSEIEELLNSLRVLDAKPCNCAERGGEHAKQCEIGGMIMKANIRILAWVLGKDKDLQKFVNIYNKAAREI